VVTLERPTPYFLNLVSFCAFFPVSHHVDTNIHNWALEASPSFVCNGPFSLGAWKHHNELMLQKNPSIGMPKAYS
jgi:oligopeptide transport system substrate-binding protein